MTIVAQNGRWGGAVLTGWVRSTAFEATMTQVQIPVPALNSCSLEQVTELLQVSLSSIKWE